MSSRRRIQAVPGNLRADHVAVGGEGAGLDQNGAAGCAGAIETGQQQVKIHAQGVHRDYFLRQCAAQQRQRRLQLFGVTDPG